MSRAKQNVINNVIGWIQMSEFGITDKRHAIHCIYKQFFVLSTSVGLAHAFIIGRALCWLMIRPHGVLVVRNSLLAKWFREWVRDRVRVRRVFQDARFVLDGDGELCG